MAYEIISRDTIPHYYGDRVRILFLAAAGIAFIGIPFWGHMLPFGTMFEVIGGIVLIALAGLTNPRTRWVMVLNIIASGFGAFLLELSAISFRARDAVQLLYVRELGALLFIAALYYSVKTLRSMAQGKIGEWPAPDEFEKPTAAE